MEHGNLPLYPYTELTEAPSSKPTINAQPVPTAPGPTPYPTPAMHMLLGPENTVTVCQFCSASIKTAVKYTNNTKTHIAAALCGMICCCCCIPYCSESAKNSDHYCPNCQRYLGTYHK